MNAPPLRVGVLGGMGPAAGVTFVQHFVHACERVLRNAGLAVHDQAFPEHWLAQLPLPDRTVALQGAGPSPLNGMAKALDQFSALGVEVAGIACNTAHAWFAPLRESTRIELLHIVDETVAEVLRLSVRSVALMATLGTHRQRLYELELERAGIVCHVPKPDERDLVMRGIRDGIKAGDLTLARTCFGLVARRLADRHHPDAIVLACTEIPLGLAQVEGHSQLRLIDPSQVLAHALAAKAYRLGPPS
jgi:aspartate racemase